MMLVTVQQARVQDLDFFRLASSTDTNIQVNAPIIERVATRVVNHFSTTFTIECSHIILFLEGVHPQRDPMLVSTRQADSLKIFNEYRGKIWGARKPARKYYYEIVGGRT
jgi:hypothetical protein